MDLHVTVSTISCHFSNSYDFSWVWVVKDFFFANDCTMSWMFLFLKSLKVGDIL